MISSGSHHNPVGICRTSAFCCDDSRAAPPRAAAPSLAGFAGVGLTARLPILSAQLGDFRMRSPPRPTRSPRGALGPAAIAASRRARARGGAGADAAAGAADLGAGGGI